MANHINSGKKTKGSPLMYLALLALVAVNAYIIAQYGSASLPLSDIGGSTCVSISERTSGSVEHCGDLYLLTDGSTALDGSFRSSNEAVAVFNEGSVSAVSSGDARVISVSDGRYRYWTVKVSDYQSCIAPMGTKVSLTPETACTQWSCSDTAAAAVDENGVLTPKAVGECTVTATDDSGRQYGWKVSVKRTAYITIDDWPNDNTGTILDTLKKYDIKATFFLVGQRDYLDLYQRIIDEGHSIGNHTRSHNFDVVYASSDSLVRSVELMDEWLLENFDATTKLFRFPGGYYGRTDEQRGAFRMLSQKGYRIYDWTCSVDDVKYSDHDDIMRLFKKTLNEDVEVILMHNSKAAAALLEDVIKHLQENNYVCLPLDETSPTFDFVHRWSE